MQWHLMLSIVLWATAAKANLECRAFAGFFQSENFLFLAEESQSRFSQSSALSSENSNLLKDAAIAYNAHKGQWQHASGKVPDGLYTFIIDKNSVLRIAPEELPIRHGHLSNAEPVLGFGEITFASGSIIMITPNSGLYYYSAKEQVAAHLKLSNFEFNVVVLNQIQNILRSQDPNTNYELTQFALYRVAN